jgi:hypothetical protein
VTGAARRRTARRLDAAVVYRAGFVIAAYTMFFSSER